VTICLNKYMKRLVAKVTYKYDVQANNLELHGMCSSDEVEGRVFLLKTSVRLWWFVASSTSFTDKGSESVSVSDNRWLLDGTRNVVVGEAELVCQRLNQVRRGTDGVVNNSVPSWSSHTLLGGHRNQIELVDVHVSDGRVNHSSWKWVLEAAWVSSKESGVDSLACVDVHESG